MISLALLGGRRRRCRCSPIAPFFGIVALLVLANGAGSLIVEICTETVLQEELPDDVFARAYGFAFPVSIAGIAAGSIVAAPLVAALGLAGGLTVIGATVVAYAMWLSGPVTVSASDGDTQTCAVPDVAVAAHR